MARPSPRTHALLFVAFACRSMPLRYEKRKKSKGWLVDDGASKQQSHPTDNAPRHRAPWRPPGPRHGRPDFSPFSCSCTSLLVRRTVTCLFSSIFPRSGLHRLSQALFLPQPRSGWALLLPTLFVHSLSNIGSWAFSPRPRLLFPRLSLPGLHTLPDRQQLSPSDGLGLGHTRQLDIPSPRPPTDGTGVGQARRESLVLQQVLSHENVSLPSSSSATFLSPLPLSPDLHVTRAVPDLLIA